VAIKEQRERFSSVLKNLPQKPGVYRYYNVAGDLLYVGKAKVLKNRVNQYFQETKVHNRRIYLMVNQIDKIEYTVVTNEREALLLEANLIYNLQPRFNILLKDEKNYLYLKFTYNESIPGIFIDRKKTNPHYVYYGPYFARYRLSDLLRTLRMIFPYCEKRTSPDNSPCDYVALGMCNGICCGKETLEEYTERLKQVEQVMNGRTEGAENYIDQHIATAVAETNFERAAFWRDRKHLLNQLFKTSFAFQKVVLPTPEDVDLVTFTIEKSTDGLDMASIFVQNIRDGKIINVNNFIMAGSEDLEEGISLENDFMSFVERFFTSFYTFDSAKAPVMVQVFQSEG
jgi:excinuclease ABC subunit C